MPWRSANLIGPVSLMLVLAVYGPLWAEPLDRKELPADVRWFVHVDVDAARQSQVFKTLRSLWLSNPVPKQWMNDFRDATGSDAIDDFHGITVFSNTYEPNQGVAIIRGEIDHARVLALVSGLPDHHVAAHGSYEMHLWTDPKTDRTSAGAFHGKNTLVIGSDPDAVGAELDLLDGKGKAMGGGSPLAEPAPPGTFVELAARGISAAHDLPFRSPIVKQSNELTVSIGQKDDRTFAHGRLTMDSPEVASQIRALLDGMRALATLKANGNPTLAKLLSAVQTSADDRSVRVDWEAANEDVARGIRQQLEHRSPSATQPDEHE